jgi:hypothetical protein
MKRKIKGGGGAVSILLAPVVGNPIKAIDLLPHIYLYTKKVKCTIKFLD